MQPSSSKLSRSRLIQLCAVALVPIGFAYLLYFIVEGKEPWGSTSKGQLLKPIISAETLGFRNLQGEKQDLASHEVWWLLVVSDGICTEACEEALHLVRGAHVLLNKDMSRARRAWLSLRSDLPVNGLDKINDRYPQLKRFIGKPGALKAGVYIIDPLANIVLYYQYAEAGKPLLDDLKKLLKVSRIG